MKLFALIYCQDSFGSDDDSYIGVFDSMDKLNEFCSINRIEILSENELKEAKKNYRQFF